MVTIPSHGWFMTFFFPRLHVIDMCCCSMPLGTWQSRWASPPSVQIHKRTRRSWAFTKDRFCHRVDVKSPQKPSNSTVWSPKNHGRFVPLVTCRQENLALGEARQPPPKTLRALGTRPVGWKNPCGKSIFSRAWSSRTNVILKPQTWRQGTNHVTFQRLRFAGITEKIPS